MENLWNILESVFIWVAFARMRFDRELACDASVLASVSEGERRRYGSTLIAMLERFSTSQHLPAVAGILETEHN